ncbi:hypothetical protein EMPG_16838 [Blastomyces silverae]|uniref:Uncharacterized protein n=1 Tax=Blastomyces silverae TaxID=2060906 RepID=A0A0H1B8F9_9EURO|nr:hypothetical protein EMPG_16838 [Blastomyces silverae]
MPGPTRAFVSSIPKTMRCPAAPLSRVAAVCTSSGRWRPFRWKVVFRSLLGVLGG